MSISSFLTKKFLKSLFFPAHNRGAALPNKLVKLLKNPPGYWDLPELPEIGSQLSQSGLIAKSQREFSDKFGAKGCFFGCLLYTSPSPRDAESSRMPSSA